MWKFCVLAVLGSFVGANAIAGDKLLDKPVEVRVGQSGFAGVTGTVYTVDVLGNWEAVAFLNEENIAEPRSGVLTEEQIAQLLELLNNDVSSAKMDRIEINPKIVELHYGDTTSTLTLPPDAEFVGGTPLDESGHGLRRLASWFVSTIGNE